MIASIWKNKLLPTSFTRVMLKKDLHNFGIHLWLFNTIAGLQMLWLIASMIQKQGMA
jgi:hypothetical protein